MSSQEYVVLTQWDEEEGVWFVKTSNIPGLVVEAETLEQFRQVVCDVAAELIDAADGDDGCGDIPIQVKAEAVACAPRKAVAA
ncbi:DUF1902 domain-containing protein [Hyphomonas sp.]|uniref:DUF1902 domain-containing protein n=1 Tax=Hyphomonas sp. TaxID=87 RepID=UPI003002A3C4